MPAAGQLLNMTLKDTHMGACNRAGLGMSLQQTALHASFPQVLRGLNLWQQLQGYSRDSFEVMIINKTFQTWNHCPNRLLLPIWRITCLTWLVTGIAPFSSLHIRSTVVSPACVHAQKADGLCQAAARHAKQCYICRQLRRSCRCSFPSARQASGLTAVSSTVYTDIGQGD